MLIEELKKRISQANADYRAGNPSLTDQEYDDLLESLRPLIGDGKYEEFVSTLNEGGIEKDIDGKVKHPFTMGSLAKLKFEEPEELKAWMKENIRTSMSISAKVDGISSRAEFRNGKLISLTTRGDGTVGQDITDKAKYIKSLPMRMSNDFTGNIRGELVILKADFESIKDKYANARNACAGIMNRKVGDRKFNEAELRMVSFIPYTILGEDYTKVDQFAVLERCGFNVAWNTIESDWTRDGIVDSLVEMASQDFPYDTDGLVLCDENWFNEDKYRPDGCKAFKLNMSIGTTTIVGFDWGTPSASGKFTPVALLEPIQLAGTTVKRATCNNITWMEQMGVAIGKKVRLLKAGEIIPKLLEVIG